MVTSRKHQNLYLSCKEWSTLEYQICKPLQVLLFLFVATNNKHKNSRDKRNSFFACCIDITNNDSGHDRNEDKENFRGKFISLFFHQTILGLKCILSWKFIILKISNLFSAMKNNLQLVAKKKLFFDF